MSVSYVEIDPAWPWVERHKGSNYPHLKTDVAWFKNPDSLWDLVVEGEYIIIAKLKDNTRLLIYINDES